MAEFLFKDIVRKENLEKEIYVESAATSTEEIGNGIYPKAREQLVKHNIGGYKDKTARQVTKSDYREFDRCFDEIKKGCEAFLLYLKENM